MDEGGRFHRENVPAARRLRNPLTKAEALVWARVRDRKFRGFKFRRQHPIGAYVVDFFCAELGLVLEVDGGVHDEPEQRLYDQGRTEALEGLGLRVVRLTNAEVEDDLERALGALTPAPLPLRRERGSETSGRAPKRNLGLE
ncbi:MAG: endonuclease domain-containing protein [Dehalococcoidia bacterium]